MRLLLLLFIVGTAGAQIPHLIFGEVYNDESQLIPEDSFHMSSWLEQTPDLRISESSPGCDYETPWFSLQLASLPGGWQSGQNLIIQLLDDATGVQDQVTLILDNNASQSLGWVHMSAVELTIDLPENPWSLELGDELMLPLSIRTEDGGSHNVTPGSVDLDLNGSAIDISPDGLVQTLALGTAVITASVFGVAPVSVTIEVLEPEAVAPETAPDPVVILYPNPVWDRLTVQAADPITIRVWDLLGRQVYRSEVRQSQHVLALSSELGLPTGVYIVRSEAGNRVVDTRIRLIR